MNESQRGMVGAKLANLQHGGQGGKLNSAIAPLNPVTQKQAAEMLNIGVDSNRQGWPGAVDRMEREPSPCLHRAHTGHTQDFPKRWGSDKKGFQPTSRQFARLEMSVVLDKWHPLKSL